MEPRTSARDDDIGIQGYLTSASPLGGRLKVRVDDFIVDEVGGLPPEDPGGPFSCAIVRLSNWETNRFVGAASEVLQMSRKKVHFSGTKDKRGVTTQVFTFEAPPDAVQRLAKLPGVELDRVYRTRSEAHLGDHTHNRFQLVLRNIAHDEATTRLRVESVVQEAQQAGGFPNFFGPQRFGAVRATTHRVGEQILRGDFAGAVNAYLEAGPLELDAADAATWAQLLQANDHRGLLRMCRADQGFERTLLHRMIERPEDPLYALLGFPKNLQLLFVYAYQSLLFNRIVSRRMAAGLPLATATEGDLVAPIQGGEMGEEWVPVSAANLARVNEEIRRGRATVTGVLPGTQVPMADGVPGEIERAVLDEEGLRRGDFVVPEHLDWSSKGSRRALAVQARGLAVQVRADELFPQRTSATFEFELPRGSYATSVLREFMKSPVLRDYA